MANAYKPIILNQTREFKQTVEDGAHHETPRISFEIDELLTQVSSLAIESAKE